MQDLGADYTSQMTAIVGDNSTNRGSKKKLPAMSSQNKLKQSFFEQNSFSDVNDSNLNMLHGSIGGQDTPQSMASLKVGNK